MRIQHGNEPESGRLLAAALAYAAAGWPAFPCKPDAKVPATRHGCKDATTSPAAIRAWWQRTACNVAIATGAPGPDVLDVDVHATGSGWAGYEQLKSAGMITGALRMVRTRSGGLHVYFAGTTQRNGSLPRAHLDFRAAGGYVLAPPSTVGGAPYELLFSHDEQHQTFDWNAAVQLLAPDASRRHSGGGSGTAGLVAFVSRLEEGQRNCGLFWAACRAVDDGHAEALDDLVIAAIATGLSKTEATRTVASARRRAGCDNWKRPSPSAT
ncbi:MAG: bifunctional DNA primase/polymerase [Streptosporangiaceae bacterium]